MILAAGIGGCEKALRMIARVIAIPMLLLIAAIAFSAPGLAWRCTQVPYTLENVPSEGIGDRNELSGIAARGRWLYLVSNELIGDTNVVQVYELLAPGHYRFVQDFKLPPLPSASGRPCKADIEGAEIDGDKLYLIGSHSKSRSKQRPEENTLAENLSRLETSDFETCKDRNSIFQIDVDDSGKLSNPKRLPSTMSDHIFNQPALKPFGNIPSKENGIDIEGLAISDGRLFAGFRGPVLRQNYVPVLAFDLAAPQKAPEALYVQLGGRGIRGFSRADDGFVILGGPVSDAKLSFALYAWNGLTMVGGTDHPAKGEVRKLCDVPKLNGGKPEAVTVVGETDESYDLLLAYDGGDPLAVARMTIEED